MKQLLRLSAVSCALVFSLSSAVPAFAGEDCERDPVYSRSDVGRTISGARIRHRPCMTGSDVLTTAPSNAKLEVLAETDGWYKVRYGNVTGWMGSTLVQLTTNNGTKGEINLEKGKVEKIVTEKPAAGTAKTEQEWIKKNITGVTEKDFMNLEDGESSLHKKLKGKWIMRVQARGQVYMVESDGSIRLVPNWKTFAQNELKKKEVKEVKKEEKKKEEKPVTTQSNGSMSLTSRVENGKVFLSWSLQNMTSKQGFKVVVNETGNPVYPGDTYHYLSDAETRSDKWYDLNPGRTYHFRVCEYLGGTCGVYSNDVSVTMAQ